MGLPALLPGDVDQRHHRGVAAGVFVVDQVGPQIANRLDGVRVEGLGFLIGMVVTQIGADDQQRVVIEKRQ